MIVKLNEEVLTWIYNKRIDNDIILKCNLKNPFTRRIRNTIFSGLNLIRFYLVGVNTFKNFSVHSN